MSLKIDVLCTGDRSHDNFGVEILRLFCKADPHNLRLLGKGFPNAFAVYSAWNDGPDPDIAGTDHIPDLGYD